MNSQAQCILWRIARTLWVLPWLSSWYQVGCEAMLDLHHISPPTSTLTCSSQKHMTVLLTQYNWNHKYSYSSWNMCYTHVSTECWVVGEIMDWTAIGARIRIGWGPDVTWCWLKCVSFFFQPPPFVTLHLSCLIPSSLFAPSMNC